MLDFTCFDYLEKKTFLSGHTHLGLCRAELTTTGGSDLGRRHGAGVGPLWARGLARHGPSE